MSGYIGSYELLKKLGEGNFGTVYAAVGELPGRGLNAGRRRLVAVKQLNHNADQHSKDLLVQEFRLLEQVRNRSIVRVFEYIPQENAVAMEYIHGVTLSQMLEELRSAREQVFTEAAIEITCEVADALYQAWTTPGDNGEPLRLVHRDLKPDNIMITPNGDVKILDFGLARVDNADFARDDPSRLKGTPIYMAPEQAQGGTVDHRTDLFALGLVTYELLMNQAAYKVPPNSGDPLGDIFDAIERGALLDQCRELESKLPGVGPVLTRLLQPNPRSRYQDGQGVLVDLRRQLYKDRGSYLKEFCEFFFDAIYDMPEKPDMDTPGDIASASSSGPSSADAFKQRVQASMARGGGDTGGGGRAQAFNPTKSKAAVQKARPRADNLASGRGAPKRAPAPQRSAPPQRGTGGRPPGGRPPVRSAPPKSGDRSRPGLEPIKPRKIIGARAPDETGMLPLMDLSDVAGQEEEPSTATAFFAIPAPKTASRDNRAAPAPATPQPQRAPPPGAQSSGSRPAPAQPFQQPAPPSFGAPSQAPPAFGGGPPGAAYSSNQSPPGIAPAPIGIQGPVASGPVAGGYGAAAAPPPAANDPNRTSSNRIYAVVLGLVLLMGAGTAATVWYVLNKKDTVEPVAETIDYQPRERAAREPEVVEVEDEDEELDEELPPSNNGWAAAPPTNTGYVAPAAPAEPTEPEKPSGAGPLTVMLSGDSGGITGFQLTCPSGYNQRAGIAGGAASFAGVPEESCTLTTRGAKSGAFQGASAHMTLTCSFDSGPFNCF